MAYAIPKAGFLLMLLFLGLQRTFAAEANILEDPVKTVFQSTVTGTVSDELGPLVGASVLEKGTANGTQTDFDGNYTLEVSPNAVLVISYIGYATQELPVNGQGTINVTLQEDASQLDEVVLVGYGTQSRTAVTNAISSVSSEDLVETPAIGVSQALQGRAAGVQVTNTGAPGTAPQVTIRGLGTFGNNQPLFVVDGVPTTSLNSIPAESIESVDILKDASSAAIYGSRASNGVVLIKTKGGRSGKTTFNFNTYAGLSMNPKTLDVLNAQQYLEYAGSYDVDAGTPGIQLPETLRPGVVDPSIDTNWQDEIMRVGAWQSYDIDASGGSEKATYSVRAGYLKQEGTLLQLDFERFSAGVNTSLKLSDKITIGQTLNIGISETNGEGENAGSTSNALLNALRFDPTKPVFDESTNFFSEITTSIDGQDAENPVRILTNGSRVQSNTELVGSLFGIYEIIPNLTYKLTVGLDLSYRNYDEFLRSIPTGSRQRLESITNKNRIRNLNTLVTNTLNYNNTFADRHNLNVLAGYEHNKFDFDRLDAVTRNSLTDVVENLNIGDVRELTSQLTPDVLHSVFGRVEYDFDRTYLLSATFRADGSAKFSDGNRWGYFPSVSGGINFANMPFLEDNETISSLKLRGSWGITGNNNIGSFQTQSGLLTDFNYVIDGALVSGSRPARIPNELLQWEELTSINVGVDLGFLNNDLTVSLEYFENESDGLLVSVPLRPTLGSTDPNQIQNVGGTELTGMEFNVGYNDRRGDFTWGANLNAFMNINTEVTSLGDVDAVLQGNVLQQTINRLSVGEAPLHFFGLRTDGIFQNQAEVDAGPTQTAPDPDDNSSLIGNIRYVDTNGDGTINADDRVLIGDPNPDFTMNFDFNLAYKNFDFSIFLNGVYGNDIYNGLAAILEQQARLFNTTTTILDRWSPTNPSQTVPRATPTFTINENTSDRFIEDGSFTRIRSLTLGYSLGNNALKSFANGALSKLRFYIQGQNLATFTDYSGYDPEIVPILSGGTTQAIGLDVGRYPQPRTVIAGLQVQF
ncbi:MAG: TonB-dependent receptor [Bacteroidota bacterium]